MNDINHQEYEEVPEQQQHTNQPVSYINIGPASSTSSILLQRQRLPQQQSASNNDDEGEHVVTSTSNDLTTTTNNNCNSSSNNNCNSNLRRYPLEGYDTTSPARITSSTGNDYSSSSPTTTINSGSNRQENDATPTRNIDNCFLSSSEDDSFQHATIRQQQAGDNTIAQRQIQQTEQQQQQQQGRQQQPQQEDQSQIQGYQRTFNVDVMSSTSSSSTSSSSLSLTATTVTSAYQQEQGLNESADDCAASTSQRSKSINLVNVKRTFDRAQGSNIDEGGGDGDGFGDNNPNSVENMVARDNDNGVESGGNDSSSKATLNKETVSETKKIILKLPKPASSASGANSTNVAKIAAEFRQQQHSSKNDSAAGGSSLCSNTTNCPSDKDKDKDNNCEASIETRKVEPLKINLHHSHHHHHHHYSTHHHSPTASSLPSGQTIPKITIKPLVKKNPDVNVSNADVPVENFKENSPISKRTTKATMGNHPSTSSGNASAIDPQNQNSLNEPHVIPKLTIRATHEDGSGLSHSTIVPKLTIKISDAQVNCINNSGGSSGNSLNSPNLSNKANSNTSTSEQHPPPLPKLTIKTSIDGTSESTILLPSSLSPAPSFSSISSSSSSSCYSSSAPSPSVPNSDGSSAVSSKKKDDIAESSTSIENAGVPKFTIKTVHKSEESTAAQFVPKLTIKTSALGGACVSSAVSENAEMEQDDNSSISASSCGSGKIPKLTIKTGQEHAVIIKQRSSEHNNPVQPIPKFTIKTKALEIDVADRSGNNDVRETVFTMSPKTASTASPTEKIPKITIKTGRVDGSPGSSGKPAVSAPDSNANVLTSNEYKNSSPQSPRTLFVRELPNTGNLSKKDVSISSPDRLPKLMISRQDSSPNTSQNAEVAEKSIPKLTIKTTTLTTTTSSSIITNNQNDPSNTEAIKSPKPEKIPKITIRPIQPCIMMSQQMQTTEDNEDKLPSLMPTDECKGQRNATIPKLKIKNLCSPKPHVKTNANDEDVLNNESSVKASNASDLDNANTTKQETDSEKASKLIESSSTSNAIMNGDESNQDCSEVGRRETSSFDEQKAIGCKNIKDNVINDEIRRNSDDMDIDDGLKSHNPKIFNNLLSLVGGRNGESIPIKKFVFEALSQQQQQQQQQQQLVPQIQKQYLSQQTKSPLVKNPKATQILETVDLTSSPSPDSSPAHFTYDDDENDNNFPTANTEQPPYASSQLSELPTHALDQSSVLNAQYEGVPLNPKSRERSVIQSASEHFGNPNPITMPGMVRAQESEKNNFQSQQLSNLHAAAAHSNSLLLSQLTAPSRYPPPPNLIQYSSQVTEHAAPLLLGSMHNNNNLRYRQLPEVLLANGGLQFPINAMLATMQQDYSMPRQKGPISNSVRIPAQATTFRSRNSQEASLNPALHHVIESIEILDSPEASRSSFIENDERMQQTNIDFRDNANGGSLKLSDNEITSQLKRGKFVDSSKNVEPLNKLRRIETNSNTMTTLTILTEDKDSNMTSVINAVSPTLIGNIQKDVAVKSDESIKSPVSASQHRSRKQKHDHLLNLPLDEEDPQQALEADRNSEEMPESAKNEIKKKVRKRAGKVINLSPKIQKSPSSSEPASVLESKSDSNAEAKANDNHKSDTSPILSSDQNSKSRRNIQLLRKRLAIDMVNSEQLGIDEAIESVVDAENNMHSNDNPNDATPKRDRALRASRRCATPISSREGLRRNNQQSQYQVCEDSLTATKHRKPRMNANNNNNADSGVCIDQNEQSDILATNSLNHFGGSNSSLSSACSSSSSAFSSTMAGAGILTTMANTNNSCNGNRHSDSKTETAVGQMLSSNVLNSSQTDLSMSMSSLSSSTSNMGSAQALFTSSNTFTGSTVDKLNGDNNSMLPPTTILSSSDPLRDVVFRPQDFSSVSLAQQLQAVTSSSTTNPQRDADMAPLLKRKGSFSDSQEEDRNCRSGENSGEDSNIGLAPVRTPGRGRGRGRGRGSRGGNTSGRGGPRAHRLGRGASAVAKAIAMSRPRCMGVLKHTPDPERVKSLFNPSPQVFEEDTCMSADFSQMQSNLEPHTPIRTTEIFSNEEESQSSLLSNTSTTILDPNTIPAVQNGASVKKRKKKMEVCDIDGDFSAASIAEYDWPPPKGCCPSRNRDTFMIQEQVANYLGIKSFKRKYPDLPRRSIDMEERNWLQERCLVSERMCDLGITAVWASDILDIMYADFHEKYQEYKEYCRRKHLREMEAKQKILGFNVSGRGLQARDRAMLSASKWNAYFNKTRKEERQTCMDLQTFTVNTPLPKNAPISTLPDRSLATTISEIIESEKIAEPPTLLRPRETDQPLVPERNYPLALVPGQYSEVYKKYTDVELRSLPLNTILSNFHQLGLKAKPLRNTNSAEVVYSAEETDSAEEIVSIETTEGKKRCQLRLSRRARDLQRVTKFDCDVKLETKNQIQTEEEETNDNCNVLTKASPKETKIVLAESQTESDSDSSRSTSDSASSSSMSSSSSSSDEDENEGDREVNCAVCSRTQHRNIKNRPEIFIKCYTCRRKVHPSCIEMPNRMLTRVRNYNWQCADCKCCIKCKLKQNLNAMLYCEQCDRGYHIYCLGLKTVPDVRWSCERCSFCMRCGATKPEGLSPQEQKQMFYSNGEKIKQVKHKKVKWINQYRLDHVTQLREHSSMLCVPCARARPIKRATCINGLNGEENVSVNLNSNNNNNKDDAFTTETSDNNLLATEKLPTVLGSKHILPKTPAIMLRQAQNTMARTAIYPLSSVAATKTALRTVNPHNTVLGSTVASGPSVTGLQQRQQQQPHLLQTPKIHVSASPLSIRMATTSSALVQNSPTISTNLGSNTYIASSSTPIVLVSATTALPTISSNIVPCAASTLIDAGLAKTMPSSESTVAGTVAIGTTTSSTDTPTAPPVVA